MKGNTIGLHSTHGWKPPAPDTIAPPYRTSSQGVKKGEVVRPWNWYNGWGQTSRICGLQ